MDHQGARDYILNKLKDELTNYLYYHSYDHTIDVMRAVTEHCEHAGVSGVDKEILLTAAAYHDAGFLEQYNDNEEIGCSYARQTLPGFDYSEEQVDKVCEIIMATRHNIAPRNILEEIICDSDHDYLGRKDYKRIASNLYKELSEYGYVFNEREWITMQINFLSNKHTYYTDWAKQNRDHMKRRHVERLKEKLI